MEQASFFDASVKIERKLSGSFESMSRRGPRKYQSRVRGPGPLPSSGCPPTLGSISKTCLSSVTLSRTFFMYLSFSAEGLFRAQHARSIADLRPPIVAMGRKLDADPRPAAPDHYAIVKTDVAVDAQPEQLRYDPIRVQLELCAGEGNLPHDAGSRRELPWSHDTGGHVGFQPGLVLSLLTCRRCDRHRFSPGIFAGGRLGS
jgi:hypothetical protein